MSVTTIKQNILYALGEGSNVSNATFLTYALRWANRAYKEIFFKEGYKLNAIKKRSVFRTEAGQQTYQAPSDFVGFVVLKDESNDGIIDQVTPDEFAREVSSSSITDEAFTSSFDTEVTLDHGAILQYSETVTNTAGTTTYVRDTDYTMDYSAGGITVLSTGGMADATSYEIDYLYYTQGQPDRFCFEYDKTNRLYVFRFDPVPESEYVVSLVYPHKPDDMSASVEPVWEFMEHAIECGGVYYGSLEIIEDKQKRKELKNIYVEAVKDLVRMDQDMIPKHNRIPVIKRRIDYTNIYNRYDR